MVGILIEDFYVILSGPLYTHTFKSLDILHSSRFERSIQKRNATITLHKSLKGLEKRGQIKLGSFYPYSVTSPELEIFLAIEQTTTSGATTE